MKLVTTFKIVFLFLTINTVLIGSDSKRERESPTQPSPHLTLPKSLNEALIADLQMVGKIQEEWRKNFEIPWQQRTQTFMPEILRRPHLFSTKLLLNKDSLKIPDLFYPLFSKQHLREINKIIKHTNNYAENLYEQILDKHGDAEDFLEFDKEELLAAENTSRVLHKHCTRLTAQLIDYAHKITRLNVLPHYKDLTLQELRQQFLAPQTDSIKMQRKLHTAKANFHTAQQLLLETQRNKHETDKRNNAQKFIINSQRQTIRKQKVEIQNQNAKIKQQKKLAQRRMLFGVGIGCAATLAAGGAAYVLLRKRN